MLSPGFSEYVVRNLTEIIESEQSTREKFLHTYSLFKDLLSELTDGTGQYFSGPFARMSYVTGTYNIDAQLAHIIKKFRFIASRTGKNKFMAEPRHLDLAIYSVAGLIEHLSDELIWPEVIDKYIKSINIEKFTHVSGQHKDEYRELARVVVKEKSSTDAGNRPLLLICESESGVEKAIKLDRSWLSTWEMIWPGALLNCHNMIKDNEANYKSSANSIIVLEPDLLIDVTDIAECFQSRGTNILSYFLNRYVRYSLSLPMAIGNIVNACFDEILSEPDIDFDAAMDKALKSRHFNLFLLALVSPANINAIRDKAGPQFFNLKNVIPLMGKGAYSTEPSFISPDYGLQGRLDLLIEYDDNLQKDIIELKSGRAPSVDYYLKSNTGKSVSAGMWPNHLAQVTCYNMLLDSSFPGRNGVSAILYSSDINNPLRNAPNVNYQKQELVKARNQLIGCDHQMYVGDFRVLDMLSLDHSELFPSFAIEDLKKFSLSYGKARPWIATYFRFFTRFILKEMMAARLGPGYGRSGYSALWKDSREDKINSYSILPDLEIDYETSDFKKFYISLNRPENHSDLVCNLRRGDLVVLLPQMDDGTVAPWSNQIVKGTLKEINADTITVTLRNKEFNLDVFRAASHWAVEPDYVDSSNRNMFASLYRMLICSNRRQDLLLGRVRPEFSEAPEIKSDELNAGQLEALKQAVSAREYFLLQGPPGTGKTSYMLKNIVEHIYNNTKGNILLLAFTNRAVDEICSALMKISPDFPFLRTGSKESSEHSDKLISSLADELSMRELYIQFRATRVFVSTVSFALAHLEFLDVVGFDTAIIDEASQILEPQIVGILASVRRFIMIGDERQLPSIAVHRESHEAVKEEEAREIGISVAAESLFGRLLRQCQANGWHEAYGMLDHQARMHRDIAEFPNSRFYGGKLKVFRENYWQSADIKMFDAKSDDIYERLLGSGRMAYVDSGRGESSKVHRAEIELVLGFVRAIRRQYGPDFGPDVVGIICPFRAQCAEIIKALRQYGLDEHILVDTVERFQGSERDIIIYSAAVNFEFQLQQISSPVNIEGHDVDRKLNVAMTRARRHFLMLSNGDVCQKSHVYGDLIGFIKKNGAYSQAEEIFMRSANKNC